jgi:glycine cleavage system H protein
MAQVHDIVLPDDSYYDRKDHLWLKVEDGRVRVGLDALAQKATGTVAYIKLTPVGRSVRKAEPFGTMEAGKYVGPLKAPVAGRIIEVNAEVLAQPTLVNLEPYDRGWFVVIQPTALERDLQDLMHGADLQSWLEAEYRNYQDEGAFAAE